MTDTYDIAEVRSIRAALSGYEARCLQAIAYAMGTEAHGADVSKALGMCCALKHELEAEAGVLRLTQLSVAARRFYEPAIRQAAYEMQGAADQGPVSSEWARSLIGASGEFSYYLDNLNKA